MKADIELALSALPDSGARDCLRCHLVKAHDRIHDLEALIHRAHNQFENITVADSFKDALDMAHHGVAFTDDAAVDADTMREEYDLTGGERGKFYKREP